MSLEGLPNFLIVGAPKCGTTALYHYLAQHPQVFLPQRKEPRFFAAEYYEKIGGGDPRGQRSQASVVSDLADYKALFNPRDVNGAIAVGEASVQYLYLREYAIPRIKSILGRDVRIVIILRNPVDRAFSAYQRAIRDGFEGASFDESVAAEPERRRKNWSLGHLHTSLGFYHDQVQDYLSNFSDVTVLLYDDLLDDAGKFCRDLFGRLSVDVEFRPAMDVRYNVAGIPKSQYIHRWLTNPRSVGGWTKWLLKSCVPTARIRAIRERILQANLGPSNTKLTAEQRLRMIELFRGDIEMLSGLIGRDLSHWCG